MVIEYVLLMYILQWYSLNSHRDVREFIREPHVSNDYMWRQLGRSSSLSPYTDMKSLYFDESLYENEMHYKISKLLDEYPLGEDYEELRIKCDTEEEYNAVLDALYKAADGAFKMYGVSNNPMEIIIDEDPRKKYRKFNEDFLINNEEVKEDNK